MSNLASFSSSSGAHREINSNFLYNPHGMPFYCHAATILETHDENLMVAWYCYPEKESQDAVLVLTRKNKGDVLWKASHPIIDHLQYSVGNPVLFQEKDGNKIWIFFVILKGTYWNDAVMVGSCSDDDGSTWSAPSQLWAIPGMMVRHPPVQLSTGSLLLPAYEENIRKSVLLTSEPPYSHWRVKFKFDELELIQPVLIQGKEQELAMFFRPSNEPRCIWRSHSLDNGNSWTTPVRTPLPNPLSGVGAFMADNNYAVVYNHTEEHQRYPLSISVSPNGGTSWSDPWHIDTIKTEVSYPSFINGKNGIIHGVFTYNRRMIKYVSFNEKDLV